MRPSSPEDFKIRHYPHKPPQPTLTPNLVTKKPPHPQPQTSPSRLPFHRTTKNRQFAHPPHLDTPRIIEKGAGSSQRRAREGENSGRT
jgi:hypothetical protein